jgi:DNA polymerase I-like protein with 3'-5' exonuclease and polymerase domains
MKCFVIVRLSGIILIKSASMKKDLRNIGKIVGLALCYGGSNYTVSGNMNTNKEDAQNKIDSFFSKLSILNLYMIAAKNKVLEIGKVYNMFGRCRDVSKWAFSQNWKDKAYAQRTALNHPIQST